MSDDDQIHYVDWRRLKDFVTEALAKVGVSKEDAAIIADTLVEADLRGVDTHGAIRLAPYIKMLSEGNMNPRPDISIVRETPVTALIDADNGVGNIVAYRAAEIAIKKARDAGVGIVGVKNSTYCSALAYYPMMALKHDMIGMATINTLPGIPAYGGLTHLLGTNPYAVAIPAGEELPVVIDMATTLTAGAKIERYAKLNKKIPLDWGLNRYGEPTDDAQEVHEHGFPAWMGGPKGYSLALLANILAGVLTGGAFNPETFPKSDKVDYWGSQLIRQGHFILVFRIDNFMPVDEFKSRMDTMIRDFKASKPAKGISRVYLPGEPEFEQKEKRLKTGIPLPPIVRGKLLEVKEKLGLAGFE